MASTRATMPATAHTDAALTRTCIECEMNSCMQSLMKYTSINEGKKHSSVTRNCASSAELAKMPKDQ